MIAKGLIGAGGLLVALCVLASSGVLHLGHAQPWEQILGVSGFALIALVAFRGD